MIAPVITMLAALSVNTQTISIQDVASHEPTTQVETLLGIAGPMPALIENKSNEIIIS